MKPKQQLKSAFRLPLPLVGFPSTGVSPPTTSKGKPLQHHVAVA
nr:hypothetical protein [uncultured Kingella sp.]